MRITNDLIKVIINDPKEEHNLPKDYPPNS